MAGVGCQFSVTKDTKNRKKGEACGKDVKEGEFLCSRHKRTKLGKRIMGELGDNEPPLKISQYIPDSQKVNNDDDRLAKIA